MRITLAILGVAAIFGVLGTIDYSEALIQEAIEKVERPRRASESPVVHLSHPLPYRVIVCQSGALEKPRCRFYTGERIK